MRYDVVRRARPSCRGRATARRDRAAHVRHPVGIPLPAHGDARQSGVGSASHAGRRHGTLRTADARRTRPACVRPATCDAARRPPRHGCGACGGAQQATPRSSACGESGPRACARQDGMFRAGAARPSNGIAVRGSGGAACACDRIAQSKAGALAPRNTPTRIASSHRHAAGYGSGRASARHAGHDSIASYAASAQASASSSTSSTSNEPARQTFIVRPRVRASGCRRGHTGCKKSRRSAHRCSAALPASSAADADPSRRFPASLPSHQPSRFNGLSFEHLGRGYPYRKQGPSHRAARPVRHGAARCPGGIGRAAGALLIHRRISDVSAAGCRAGRRTHARMRAACRPAGPVDGIAGRRVRAIGSSSEFARLTVRASGAIREGTTDARFTDATFRYGRATRAAARAGLGKIPMHAQRSPACGSRRFVIL